MPVLLEYSPVTVQALTNFKIGSLYENLLMRQNLFHTGQLTMVFQHILFCYLTQIMFSQ
jgi:hypothetical protein